MSTHSPVQNSQEDNPRDIVIAAISRLDHVLPAQAPIQDFVHHNTLHGFQHLPFDEALETAEALTGIAAYHPEEKNRQFYRDGRIDDSDLAEAFRKNPALKHGEIVCGLDGKAITRLDIYRIAMIYGIDKLSLSGLNWQIEELSVLDNVQPDVPAPIRKIYAATNRSDSTNPVRRLWESLCSALGLTVEALHPEALFDLSLEQTERWLDQTQDAELIHQDTQTLANTALQRLTDDIGHGITLRGLVLALSGKDILTDIRPQLIRLCASALDEGVAPWQFPGIETLGLFGAWRTIAQFDAYPFLHELPDWPQIMSALPEDAVDTIVHQLEYFGIPRERWPGYLQRLALELPGWSGMIHWRQQRPGYNSGIKPPPSLADYFAIRLTLDRLWLNQVCRDIWKCEARINSLHAYFSKNSSEFLVRRYLHQGSLPEYLNQAAELLVIRAGSERQCRKDWQHLADLIRTWLVSPISEKSADYTVNDTAWRLFRLSQHLGLTSDCVTQLGKPGLLALLSVLDGFDGKQRRKFWLLAYERHYREALFRTLRANHGRGRWADRKTAPSAQIVFCMDDREESFRRHLEELDPSIETLGAAGFFGIAMNYKGLDDQSVTPLCPVVVTPAHEVREQPAPEAASNLPKRRSRIRLSQRLAALIQHDARNSLILAPFVILLSAPFSLIGLMTKILLPWRQFQTFSKLAEAFSCPLKTELFFSSGDSSAPATPANPRLGFTDDEQIDRIAAFMRNTGLTYGFSEIVVLMGHGSISQNNPHLAAYDCGACSGRHGGPNARVFAAMANRTEVRIGLAERGIHVPPDTWFIGAEHNTCNEAITWYDEEKVPKARRTALTHLQAQLRRTQSLSAHERCRRLASAPKNPGLDEALRHIMERAADFSQARPELGHATNAAAIVGRRSVSQSAFFDRRVFLISYDPTQDPEGTIVEGILLNVGPVGAGINLEYYFSTVNSERLGCGTKVPHNIVGLFGVMEGAGSDLRTGLPSQMTEIHEAMRLQLIVEAKTSVLEAIYTRQESLRELIAGGWILLSALDPDTGEIAVFERGLGFVPWDAEYGELQVFANSTACYGNQSLPVSPALIQQSKTEAA